MSKLSVFINVPVKEDKIKRLEINPVFLYSFKFYCILKIFQLRLSLHPQTH